jgi:hypothetical protein
MINENAARELFERVQELLKQQSIPHVMNVASALCADVAINGADSQEGAEEIIDAMASAAKEAVRREWGPARAAILAARTAHTKRMN